MLAQRVTESPKTGADSDLVVSVAPGFHATDTLIAQLTKALRDNEAGVAIASPFARGGRLLGTSWLARTLAYWTNSFLSLAAHGEIATVTGTVRIFRSEVLARVSPVIPGTDRDSEIILEARRQGVRIIEVPARLERDSVNGPSFWAQLKTGLRYRPSLWLGIPGLLPGLLPFVVALLFVLRATPAQIALWTAVTLVVQYGSLAILSWQTSTFVAKRWQRNKLANAQSSSPARTIVHVASYGNPSPGSFIPAIALLARQLTELGDRVIFVTLDVPGATWHQTIRDAGAELILVRSRSEAAKAVAALRPHIIHTHFGNFDVPMVLSSAFSRARIFWHMHSWPTYDGLSSRLRTIIKYNIFGIRVEAFVPVSRALADIFATRGVPRNKCQVVCNGVDYHWFRPPSEKERLEARAALGFTDERVILFFGRTPGKGGDVLWRALEQIERPTVLLVGAPERDRREFEKRAAVTTISSTDNTRSLYWAADVLAFPSRREGFGFVLLEAIATGLPVVASDIPPTREVASYVVDVQTVPVDDPAILAMALRRALLLPRSTEAWQVAAHRYSMEQWSFGMLELYES